MDMKKSIHKLKKSSAYSYSVTIPKEIVEKYDWKEHQKLTVKDCGRGIVEIKDYKKK